MADARECPGCGSTPKDRADYLARNNDADHDADDDKLRSCPHCGSLKCCMCDMGDDVECVSCNTDE